MILNYKAIIFDWDGTLVDSHDWVVSAHNHVRRAFDLPLCTKDDIFSCTSLSAREMYPQIYGEDTQQALELLYEFTSKNNHHSSKPYPLSEQILKKLQSVSMPMGVVSNKRHEPLNEIIDYLEWGSYFNIAIGAGYAEKDKPNAAPLLMAIEKIDTQLIPKDVLYIGDTETDLVTAQNAGCDVVLIQSDKPRPDLIKKYQPNIACNDLSELIEVLQGAEPVNKAC